MSTSGNKTPKGIMSLFAGTKPQAQALAEVAAAATKREAPVLLLEDAPETKKQSPRLVKFSASASRLSRASRFPSDHAPRRPKKSGTQCHVTFEWQSPAAKHILESLKSHLASTKCGGELQDLLKQLTHDLVFDDEFSCDIEREINEQRKLRCEVLHGGNKSSLSRIFASGLAYWFCLVACPSFKARFPQCPKLVDDLNAARKRAAMGRPGAPPGTFSVGKALHTIHKILVCEAADDGQTFYYKTWAAMNSCGLARVANAGGEFGQGFGVDAAKKEEIFEALRAEFAAAAAFFTRLMDRKAHHLDHSCVLEKNQTATLEIVPMGRMQLYELTKVWDVEEDRYKWLDGGEEGKTYVTVKSKKDGGPGFYYNAFNYHTHPFNKLLVALSNEVNLPQADLTHMLAAWRQKAHGCLLFKGFPLGLTIKEGDEVIHKFIRTHG